MAEQDQQDQDGKDPERDVRALRKAADDGLAARAEADQAKRELAFVKAGVDTDSKLGKLLLKTYEGELNTEAIKAEATEIGLLGAVTGTTDEPTDEERAQSRERANLAADNEVSSNDGPDPMKTARTAFDEARSNGETRDQAAGAYLSEMLKAAHSGDKRVLL